MNGMGRMEGMGRDRRDDTGLEVMYWDYGDEGDGDDSQGALHRRITRDERGCIGMMVIEVLGTIVMVKCIEGLEGMIRDVLG